MKTDCFPFIIRRKIAPYFFIDLVVGQYTVFISHQQTENIIFLAVNEISRPLSVILLRSRFISSSGSDIIVSKSALYCKCVKFSHPPLNCRYCFGLSRYFFTVFACTTIPSICSGIVAICLFSTAEHQIRTHLQTDCYKARRTYRSLQAIHHAFRSP